MDACPPLRRASSICCYSRFCLCQDAGSSAVRHANWQTNQLRFSAAGLHYARPLPRPRPRSPRPPLPLSPRPRDRPAPRTAPRPRPRPPPPCCFRAASTSVSSTFSTTSSGTRKYLIVLPLMYTSGSRKNWSPSCGQTGTHSAQRRLSEIQTHGAGWRVRFTRTRDVQMTSRKFRFIQLSHFSRLPLYVSPLFSSTSCGRAAVRGQGRGQGTQGGNSARSRREGVCGARPYHRVAHRRTQQ